MKQLLLLFFITLSMGSFCQKKIFNKELLLPSKRPLFISYYGSLGIHPGARLGFEYSLFFKEKTIEKKKKVKTIRKNLLVAPSISFYSHKNSHKGLLISVDLIWRRYTKRLYIIDFSAGLGNYTRYNSGTTYRVTSVGVEAIKNARRHYITPSFSFSFGKRVQLMKSFPTDIYFRNSSHIYTNFNSLIGNDTTFEIGLRMNLTKDSEKKQSIK